MSAVLRNKKMRTARNIFIFNLAFSDLLLGLCLPFLIMTKLSKQFPFPHYEIACRLSALLSTTNVRHSFSHNRFVRTIPAAAAFMSSLTIITIAVDRLRVITMAHKSQVWGLICLEFCHKTSRASNECNAMSYPIYLTDWLAGTIARHSLDVRYSIHAPHCSDQAPGSADVSPRHSRHLQSSVGSSVCKVKTALPGCYNGTWAIEHVVEFSCNECYLIIRRRS